MRPVVAVNLLVFIVISCSCSNTAEHAAVGEEDAGNVADSGDTGDAGDPSECPVVSDLSGSTPLPPEVDAILEARCRECHGDPPAPDLHAPMALVDWEDVQAPRPGSGDKPVFEVLAQRINEPVFRMPPIVRDPLDDDERELLNAWVAECAPPAAEP